MLRLGCHSVCTATISEISPLAARRARFEKGLHAGGQRADDFNQVFSHIEAPFDRYSHLLCGELVNCRMRFGHLVHIVFRHEPLGIQENSQTRLLQKLLRDPKVVMMPIRKPMTSRTAVSNLALLENGISFPVARSRSPSVPPMSKNTNSIGLFISATRSSFGAPTQRAHVCHPVLQIFRLCLSIRNQEKLLVPRNEASLGKLVQVVGHGDRTHSDYLELNPTIPWIGT